MNVYPGKVTQQCMCISTPHTYGGESRELICQVFCLLAYLILLTVMLLTVPLPQPQNLFNAS